jgi:hypothetical protein
MADLALERHLVRSDRINDRRSNISSNKAASARHFGTGAEFRQAGADTES